jgi:hypothetical protein
MRIAQSRRRAISRPRRFSGTSYSSIAFAIALPSSAETGPVAASVRRTVPSRREGACVASLAIDGSKALLLNMMVHDTMLHRMLREC